ncbi:hypothetical protein DFQ01_112141 [Paenibacillus cellulosilyticus]|uniref:Uncharacterized protein n=1 Tax=Paenibacillus cellulosilyticus TaxID=375489 RepID=A0A2V2YRS1_9BACL|nr:phytanoyl-CoA dioxygenase family protein [Paenibacillus cellulosilyticus]PWW00788.1 hypothetical protein DFQ01_112141 [Paenibacillus cellulosilyticus]QKS45641.1 hypothetical protein HUB94_15260 [Paenibacillus cellulosilyticus]
MILTNEQIEHFIEKGWVKIIGAIPREIALKAQQQLWQIAEQKFGITEDRQTWGEPLYQLSENYRDGVFSQCSTPKLMDSIKELLGHGRLDESYEKKGIPFGWWPINLSAGATEEWNVPVHTWHWDGIHFRSHVHNPDHGLLMFVLFSDIGPRGGGALLAEGSHKLVIQFLQNYLDGTIEYKEDALTLIDKSNPWLAELTGNFTQQRASERIGKFMEQEYLDESGARLKVVECVGETGDVFLINPFIYRTGSQNHSGKARIMCNFPVPLKEKMNLHREDDAGYSLLEQSIRRAFRT